MEVCSAATITVAPMEDKRGRAKGKPIAPHKKGYLRKVQTWGYPDQYYNVISVLNWQNALMPFNLRL